MPENNVFVNVDFSDSKAAIDEALDSDDVARARQVSEQIGETQEDIKNSIQAVGGKLVFENLTNLIVYVPYDEELIEGIADVYEHYIGIPTNIGVGRTPVETYKSLGSVESGRKGNVVVSSVSIREDLAANREFYKTAKKSRYDLKIANVIKAALLELNIITTESKVYKIFMKLAAENSLNTIEELQSFFYRPLEELKQEIRNVYEKRVMGEKSQSFPGQSVLPKSKRQKSPHRRHDWWSIEEYNKDQVDYSKTDLQYINQNQTPESQQFSMGGEPGEPIATT